MSGYLKKRGKDLRTIAVSLRKTPNNWQISAEVVAMCYYYL